MPIIEKYRAMIHSLADDALFSPASIAQRPEVAVEDCFRLYRLYLALKRIILLTKFKTTRKHLNADSLFSAAR